MGLVQLSTCMTFEISLPFPLLHDHHSIPPNNNPDPKSTKNTPPPASEINTDRPLLGHHPLQPQSSGKSRISAMTDGSPDRRKRSKWDDAPRDSRASSSSARDAPTSRDTPPRRDPPSSSRDDRDRSSGRSRWDDRREERHSRSPGSSSRRRSRSPVPRSPDTPSASAPVEPKKAVDPAAAAGLPPATRPRHVNTRVY